MPSDISPQQPKFNLTITHPPSSIPQSSSSTAPHSPPPLSSTEIGIPSPTDGLAQRNVQVRNSHSSASRREVAVKRKKGFRGKVTRQVRSLKRGVDVRAVGNMRLSSVWGRLSDSSTKFRISRVWRYIFCQGVGKDSLVSAQEVTQTVESIVAVVQPCGISPVGVYELDAEESVVVKTDGGKEEDDLVQEDSKEMVVHERECGLDEVGDKEREMVTLVPLPAPIEQTPVLVDVSSHKETIVSEDTSALEQTTFTEPMENPENKDINEPPPAKEEVDEGTDWPLARTSSPTNCLENKTPSISSQYVDENISLSCPLDTVPEQKGTLESSLSQNSAPTLIPDSTAILEQLSVFSHAVPQPGSLISPTRPSSPAHSSIKDNVHGFPPASPSPSPTLNSFLPPHHPAPVLDLIALRSRIAAFRAANPLPPRLPLSIASIKKSSPPPPSTTPSSPSNPLSAPSHPPTSSLVPPTELTAENGWISAATLPPALSAAELTEVLTASALHARVTAKEKAKSLPNRVRPDDTGGDTTASTSTFGFPSSTVGGKATRKPKRRVISVAWRAGTQEEQEDETKTLDAPPPSPSPSLAPLPLPSYTSCPSIPSPSPSVQTHPPTPNNISTTAPKAENQPPSPSSSPPPPPNIATPSTPTPPPPPLPANMRTRYPHIIAPLPSPLETSPPVYASTRLPLRRPGKGSAGWFSRILGERGFRRVEESELGDEDGDELDLGGGEGEEEY